MCLLILKQFDMKFKKSFTIVCFTFNRRKHLCEENTW